MAIFLLQTSLVQAANFNDFSSQLRNTKKVTIDCSSLDCKPTYGIELNRAFKETYFQSYVASNQTSLNKLIEALNKSVVKAPSPQNPQLMYVNFLITFELKDKSKIHLLIGKYYQTDSTIEAELRDEKNQVQTCVLDKMVHKAVRDWVLQYAKIDKELAFSKFQQSYQANYSSRIHHYEEFEALQEKIFAARGVVRPSGIGTTTDLINEGYKAKLARCNDHDNPDFHEGIRWRRDKMLVSYFKADTNQVCRAHEFFLQDPNYCEGSGMGGWQWEPSYNHWNKNNLEAINK